MTRNQISYQNMLLTERQTEETARSNRVREEETRRSNLAVEAETQAHNKAQDTIAAIKLGADYVSAFGKLAGGVGSMLGSVFKLIG